MTIKDYIIISVSIIGLIWYYLCIIALGWKPAEKDTPAAGFRTFMSLSVTTIGTSLAAFFGMLIGLKTVSGSFEGVQDGSAAVQNAAHAVNTALSGSLQWVAAGLYVLSLVLGLYFWWRGDARTDPAILNLGKSFLGLIAGVIAIALRI